MSYTLTIGVVLGPSKTGLTLRAKLLDTQGNAGNEIATGFVEIGSGNYLWTYDGFSDGFRGGVKFYPSGQEATVLAFCPLNPQEVEAPSIDPDALAAVNVDSTGGELTLAKALEAIVARCVGNLSYNTETGVATFFGRDGQTTITTVKLTGGGNRTESAIE
jgi:hypothetical protein